MKDFHQNGNQQEKTKNGDEKIHGNLIATSDDRTENIRADAKKEKTVRKVKEKKKEDDTGAGIEIADKT